jgi:asparagine synthetase B (glutamine-hydrolysing)
MILQHSVKVSNFLGTVHHEYVFTIEEALDALPDVLALGKPECFGKLTGGCL